LKNKKKTYLLLVLVLAVWGTVAYKIISALNPELPQIKQYDFATNTNYRIDTKIDTFSIETVNRDPFLGTVLVKEKKPKKTVKAKPIQWLPVEYQGIVNGTNGKNQIFIISINGNQKLLKKGQTQDSVTLVYGNSKLVKMRYKNQLKSFPLKK
tara:strand:+ start:381 stop:839 length:459 start_codon:yes stop_codon:yes gene_type:complete